MADSKKVLEIIKAIGLKMEAEKEYLTELDQPIGDSDHGVNTVSYTHLTLPTNSRV